MCKFIWVICNFFGTFANQNTLKHFTKPNNE